MWRARITVHFRLVSRWIPRPTVLHELGSQWRRRGETAGNSHAVCIVAARSGTRVPRHKTGRCHEKTRNHRRCGAAAAIADPDFGGADYKAITKMIAATPTDPAGHTVLQTPETPQLQW